MKVKNILVRFELEGRGVVNFDDAKNQKYMFNKENDEIKRSQKVRNLHTNDNNVTYAKKAFFRNEDGELDYKLKISSECLKKALFDRDYISDNPAVQHFKSLAYNFMGSVPGQLRGYLFTKPENVKRKGSINITDSIQTCNAQSYLDFHTKATDRNDKSEKTSLYNSENVGDIKYSGMGNIDLKNLQFVSCDACFDRRSFNEDDFPMLKDFLSKNIKTFNSELGYFTMKNSAVDIPEYGFMYNNEDVNFLVKEYLHRLVEAEIKRKNAYTKVSKVEIKFVYDVFEDTHSNESGWIQLKSRDDIDNLSFEMEEFYEENDYDSSLEKRLAYEAEMKELVKENKKTTEKTNKKTKKK